MRPRKVDLLRRHDTLRTISHRIEAKAFKGQAAEFAASSSALLEPHILVMLAVVQS